VIGAAGPTDERRRRPTGSKASGRPLHSHSSGPTTGTKITTATHAANGSPRTVAGDVRMQSMSA
jgi:hypothetical protein